MYVIEGNAEPLLGRDSIFKLKVLTQVINSVNRDSNSELDSLLKEYSDIFEGLGRVTNFEHKIAIDPEVEPVSQHLRRIPVSQIEAVNNELDRMLEQDVIEEVNEPSPWVSNLVIVPKKSGDLRVCCDLREVNKAVIRERYVLPKVDDTLHALRGSKYFAKIDAKSGFFQLPLAEESRYITTFITPRGCYRFKRTPFGLSDASEAFQKMMDKILFGVEGVRISIDDVVIHAPTMAELTKRLQQVFERCRKFNLKLNKLKCEFGVRQISILGHLVSASGIQPDPTKTEAIKATPPPENVSDLRSFLGTCGYVAKFIPNYANIVEPLRKLTRKEQKWLWGEEQTKAFEALKESLSREPVLACFHLDAPTFVVTDASPVGLGAILLQDQGTGQRKPIAYISRSLSPTERRYSQIEREALGCVWAVERLHNYLFGVKFTLLTDNKPLSSMFDPHSSKVLPPRIQRLAWRLHQYDFRIAHISGNANTADSLSRLPSKRDDHSDSGFVCEDYVRFVCTSNLSDLQAVTLSEIKSETSKDATLSNLLAEITNRKWSHDQQLKEYRGIKEELSVYEGVILRGNRIVVPQSLRKRILKLAHETHQGIVKTKQFLRARFFWPCMDQAVEDTIKGCSACVLNRPLDKYTPLQPTPLPRGPWVKGAVDLVGPIDGKYILTYIDYYSSYPEACVLKEITSREVIKALADIFSRFGYPEELVSDNGKQFTSAEFEAFLKSCGIKHIRASPYYARSNGKLERFHRYLKKNFRAAIADGKSWQKELPKILMLYRASPHPVSGKSPAMLLFNRELRMKVPHIESHVNTALDREHREQCDSYQTRLKIYHDAKQHAAPHDFNIGDIVYCANMTPNKLDSKFSPAKHVIIKSQGRDTFSVVNVTTGATLVRNAKYLKRAPACEVVTDSNGTEQNVGVDESKDPNNSEACANSEPTVHVEEQATQNGQSEGIITTRSGRVVKSTKDCDNFVYY